MRITVVYIREYPKEIGAVIARVLKDREYTLTGSMTEVGLVWELAVRNCDDRTSTLLECAVSEYVVRGAHTVELDNPHTLDYTVTRLCVDGLGIDTL